MLLGSVESITEIAKARDDELVRVQTGVNDRSENLHIGVMPFDERDAFRRGNDADHADVARPGFA